MLVKEEAPLWCFHSCWGHSGGSDGVVQYVYYSVMYGNRKKDI